MRKLKQILLLAGGDGTRFWPLSDKNLMRFLGKELILHQLDHLQQFAEKIYLVANEINQEKIRSLTKNIPFPIEIIVQNKDHEGQAGAILASKGKLKGEVLVMNANDIFDYSILTALIKRLDHDTIDFIFLAKEVQEYFPGGYVKSKNGKIHEIIEKPPIDQVPSTTVKLVVDYFSDMDKLISFIETVKVKRDDCYEMGLNALIKAGYSCEYLIYSGYWYSLKYPWHVLPLSRFYLNGLKGVVIGKNVTMSKNTCIIGPVYIEDGVKIGDFSKIVGPVYLGKNSIIGDFSLIRESSIGQNCLIGSGNEIARSYVGDHGMLHRNYVGDSVLDNGVLMGAGVVTANFRFDEAKVADTYLKKLGSIIGSQSKIGVMTSLYPGVKIGRNTFIAPGSVIDKDVPDNKFSCRGTLKENLHFKSI